MDCAEGACPWTVPPNCMTGQRSAQSVAEGGTAASIPAASTRWTSGGWAPRGSSASPRCGAARPARDAPRDRVKNIARRPARKITFCAGRFAAFLYSAAAANGPLNFKLGQKSWPRWETRRASSAAVRAAGTGFWRHIASPAPLSCSGTGWAVRRNSA